MKFRDLVLAGGLSVACLAGGAAFFPPTAEAAKPTKPAKPAISEEASTALRQMGETLRADQLSFTAHTIRVYSTTGSELLHIFHTLKVVLRRPDRLLAEVTGDDGTSKFVFDGKTAYVFSVTHNKYAKIPVPGGTIEALLQEAVGRLGVDMPLADFLTSAPSKAFLTGVASGGVVDTVTIDGAPYLHLLFSQPPGIELELWLSKNKESLPRRLIVTYHMLPGSPNFIAEFSDWNFTTHPEDSVFAFTPPAGAEQVALKPVGPPPAKKAK